MFTRREITSRMALNQTLGLDSVRHFGLSETWVESATKSNRHSDMQKALARRQGGSGNP